MLCDIDLGDLWDDVGPFVGITRTGLHAALRADAGRHRTGMPVTSVRQDDGGVSACFGDGTTAVYDLVVGADGINSDVRRSAVGLSAPAYGWQMVWRSLARIPHATLDAVQFWLGSDRFFALCPAGDGITYGFGNITCPRMRDPADGRKRRLAGLFADFAAPVRDFLAAVETDGAMRRSEDAPGALAAFACRRGSRLDWVRGQSQALGDLVRLPAAVRNTALREHGAAAFFDRYRPLTAAP